MRLLIKFIKLKRRVIRKIKSFGERVTKEDMETIKRYESQYPFVLSTKDTLEKIIMNHCSLVRYGDAEFDICNQINVTDPYQRPCDELTKRLIEILNYTDKKILVCIPPFNSSTNNIKNYYGKLSFWEFYWHKQYKIIRPLIKNNTYGNSFISRETLFYENKLSQIIKIWDNREVIFVYGKGGRFDENSILFNNIQSKQTIYIPCQNAFDEYESTLKSCLIYSKDKLFLIAAGPTAVLLCFDLFKLGFQALDIGHLTSCYEQYCGTIISPESIPLKRS